jgi:hypothetical protein
MVSALIMITVSGRLDVNADVTTAHPGSHRRGRGENGRPLSMG